jgi:hypothetical protein
MTKWTKVKPTRGGYGTPARSQFAVQRPISSGGAASFIIPEQWAALGSKASVYSDGNGKLAFSIGDTGEYVVGKSGPQSRAKKVTIPSAFTPRLPYGTTDCRVEFDGSLIVLDLSQFGDRSLAAE